MNDLIKNKEQTWNSRLKKCIETKGYSQKQLLRWRTEPKSG